MLLLVGSSVAFMLPLPCLRLTRSTPEPSAPSLTRTARFHQDEEQLAEHAVEMEQFAEQLDCRLVCSHIGSVKSVIWKGRRMISSVRFWGSDGDFGEEKP